MMDSLNRVNRGYIIFVVVLVFSFKFLRLTVIHIYFVKRSYELATAWIDRPCVLELGAARRLYIQLLFKINILGVFKGGCTIHMTFLIDRWQFQAILKRGVPLEPLILPALALPLLSATQQLPLQLYIHHLLLPLCSCTPTGHIMRLFNLSSIIFPTTALPPVPLSTFLPIPLSLLLSLLFGVNHELWWLLIHGHVPAALVFAHIIMHLQKIHHLHLGFAGTTGPCSSSDQTDSSPYAVRVGAGVLIQSIVV